MSKVTDKYYKEMIEVAKLEQRAGLISDLDQDEQQQFKNLFAEISTKLSQINEINIWYSESKKSHQAANQFILHKMHHLTIPKVKPLFQFFMSGHKDLQLYRKDIYLLFNQIKALKKDINYLMAAHKNIGLRLNI